MAAQRLAGGLLEQRYRCTLLFLALLLYKFVALMPAHAAPPESARSGAAKIRIAHHGWGRTGMDDLRTVLEAVATELGSHFPGRDPGPIQVVPASDHPMVLFERAPGGEYVVQLSARDARWYQFVYQFSHELCHIYSNFDNKEWKDGAPVTRNQWFEESLCEAAALFTLRTLAARWESAPPGEKWSAHAALLRKYADRLQDEPHRRLPASLSFANWFRDNHRALQGSPYLREKDEVVSGLLLPLFEAEPGNWGAIGYLNARRDDAGKPFPDYLRAWREACPERYRKVVGRIAALFDPLPPTTVAAADPAF